MGMITELPSSTTPGGIIYWTITDYNLTGSKKPNPGGNPTKICPGCNQSLPLIEFLIKQELHRIKKRKYMCLVEDQGLCRKCHPAQTDFVLYKPKRKLMMRIWDLRTATGQPLDLWDPYAIGGWSQMRFRPTRLMDGTVNEVNMQPSNHRSYVKGKRVVPKEASAAPGFKVKAAKPRRKPKTQKTGPSDAPVGEGAALCLPRVGDQLDLTVFEKEAVSLEGSEVSQRYQIHEHSVIDLATGLEWQREAVGKMTWAVAMKYAAYLRLNGLADWRLPTIKELITLIDYTKEEPASSFPGMLSHCFWSSSYSGSSYGALFVSFRYGNMYDVDKSNDYNVRCVRGGPCSRSCREGDRWRPVNVPKHPYGLCRHPEHKESHEAYHFADISLRDNRIVGPAIRWFCPICRVWWDMPTRKNRDKNGPHALS